MSLQPVPTLKTSRGPHGEIVVTKHYTNFKYSLTMTAEGAIQVKPGDWLSKYSMAMYNNFAHIHEFARKDRSGKLRPIQNVNLIFAGETVYHIPTYRKAHPALQEPIEIFGSPLSEEEKNKAIVKMLEADYGLAGERGEILERAEHIAHVGETGLEIAEIAGLLAEGAAAVTVGQIIAGVLTPIGIGIAVLNAHETDMKVAGMKAICYTTTAWAFDDPIPGFPASQKANLQPFPGLQALPRLEGAWKSAADATVRNLESEVIKRRVHKRSYQIFLKALGGGERKGLARKLMEVRAEELNDVERRALWGLNPDNYPN